MGRMRVDMIHWRTCSGLQISLYTHQGHVPGLGENWAPWGVQVLQFQPFQFWAKHCCIWLWFSKLMTLMTQPCFTSTGFIFSIGVTWGLIIPAFLSDFVHLEVIAGQNVATFNAGTVRVPLWSSELRPECIRSSYITSISCQYQN